MIVTVALQTALISKSSRFAMDVVKSERFLTILLLWGVFLSAVTYSLTKWATGKTGLHHDIRRQDMRVLPAITLWWRRAPPTNVFDNLTEDYLNMEPLDQHVLQIAHYNVEGGDGYVAN